MLPTLLGLPPKAQFEDVVRKVNQLVQELTNVLLNLDSLNVISLTADHIDTGTLLAALVTIKANLNSGAYIRIDGNGMTVNDGTNDVFTVDVDGFVTLTGALFQTAAGYPKVTIDPATTLFKAEQSATNRVEIAASYSGSSPALIFTQGGLTKGVLQEISGTDLYLSSPGGDNIQISSNAHIYLNTGSGSIKLNTTNLEINGSNGYTGSYSDGTKTITVKNGIITNVV